MLIVSHEALGGFLHWLGNFGFWSGSKLIIDSRGEIQLTDPDIKTWSGNPNPWHETRFNPSLKPKCKTQTITLSNRET